MKSNSQNKKQSRRSEAFAVFMSLIVYVLLVCGCAETGGYSNESLFPEEVGSVYVEMFESRSFRRGVEYELTDALAKRIEAETPYKIVSSRDRADTILSGQIMHVGTSGLSSERRTGRALEKEVQVQAVVNWKNLKTGELLIDNESVSASASYSEWQNQGFRYGSVLAANKLAQRIVELMEKEW
jgi:hypothetical protein